MVTLVTMVDMQITEVQEIAVTAMQEYSNHKKRGMSSAAKGTIIGTVGGAAAGALISKGNRGAGAVIGGILGAGAGYAIGRANDRKTGRVQPRY